ncbi:MAG TPA: TlpA disulfide reductase family protein [Cyclobacteriaceae bacterium]
MSTSVIQGILKKVWREARPWLLIAAVFLVLRSTGALSGLQSAAGRVVLASGFMNANPDSYDPGKKAFEYSFSVTTPDGKTVDFNTYRGKTVFLNLWATWCGPCRAEMPSIQKLYEQVGNDSVQFVMLSIDRQEDIQKVRDYVSSRNFTFPVFIAGDLPEQLQVRIIPSTFVIAPDGTVAYRKTGMADYNTDKFKKFLHKVSSGESRD